MTATTYRFMDRLGVSGLLRIAKRMAGEEMGREAVARALDELLEIEIEHRTIHSHANAGYAKASALAFAGEAATPRTGQSDRVELAAERHRGANAWRALVLELLAPLPERQQRAVLVSRYLIPPTRAARRSPRMMTSVEACQTERQAEVFQRLGWPPGSAPMFKDAGALRNATCTARRRMRAALEEKIAAADE